MARSLINSQLNFSGKIHDVDVVLLARHGRNHSIMPTNVNYRANIWALKVDFSCNSMKLFKIINYHHFRLLIALMFWQQLPREVL